MREVRGCCLAEMGCSEQMVGVPEQHGQFGWALPTLGLCLHGEDFLDRVEDGHSTGHVGDGLAGFVLYRRDLYLCVLVVCAGALEGCCFLLDVVGLLQLYQVFMYVSYSCWRRPWWLLVVVYGADMHFGDVASCRAASAGAALLLALNDGCAGVHWHMLNILASVCAPLFPPKKSARGKNLKGGNRGPTSSPQQGGGGGADLLVDDVASSAVGAQCVQDSACGSCCCFAVRVRAPDLVINWRRQSMWWLGWMWDLCRRHRQVAF